MIYKRFGANLLILCYNADISEGKEMVMPGEDANINLRMNKQMTFNVGQQFTIRSGGATIASGKVKL